MDDPLFVEVAFFVVAIVVCVWSQYFLPPLSDARNILFLITLFIGGGALLGLLTDGLCMLVTGDVASEGGRLIGSIVLLVILWKPVNYLAGIVNDAKQKSNARRGK